MCRAVLFQNSNYFRHQVLEVLYMSQKMPSMNLINRVVGQETKPVFEIVHNIYTGQVDCINTYPSLFFRAPQPSSMIKGSPPLINRSKLILIKAHIFIYLIMSELVSSIF